IEKVGGYVASIEKGWIHRKVASYFNAEHAKIESAAIKVVGLNSYVSSAKIPPIKVFKYPKGAEERQIAKLAKLKSSRDNTSVSKALKDLEDACRGSVNIFPYSLACARAGCTEGEVFAVFKKAFGLWRPPAMF
ncbi:MAG: methylmalonyl-CoA mutase family protein, partial [Deltaproteobacteria bacterium]|nr:methylmalonyl-CoA mutase family protein [Deltaproteobacteria bacterium]